MADEKDRARSQWREHPTPNRIIDATERLLEDTDIRSISVADIMAAADVARGTFYLWFDNKFDLIGKAYVRASADIFTAGERWVQRSSDDGDPLQSLEELFGASVESWIRHGPVLRAVQDTWRTEPAVAAHWLPGLRWARTIVARKVAAANGRDRQTTADRTVAGALVNLSEQTLYQASIGDEFGLDSGVQKTVAAIWHQAIYEMPGRTNR